MTSRVGVAISTTGDEHRLGFLETCVAYWDAALGASSSLFVTVDGSAEDTRRVQDVVRDFTESVYQVGQPHPDLIHARPAGPRMGVAVNKNTGLELLMDNTQVEHLFLSDDDTWPLFPQSLSKHIDFEYPHSMVCWGQSRLDYTQRSYAAWKWPRGVLLYQHRSVVDRVGGMDERFGPGGHEHVEYSQRIHNAGLTAEPFVTPASYATRTGKGARMVWHAEDMRKPGETLGQHAERKRALTSIRKTAADRRNMNELLDRQAGSDAFVPYRAHDNGRASATLCENLMSQGDCAVEPAMPRSEK